MKRGKNLRCHVCHKPFDPNSNFCKFCGAKIRTIRKGVRKCQNCKKEVEDFSSYCRHCGTSLARGKKLTSAKVLTYILSFILLLTVLFIFYTSLSKIGPPEREQLQQEPTAELLSVTCNWETNSFKICQTTSWRGGSYAKGYIPGGESLELSPSQYSDFFVYCQDVGKDEGFRIVKTMLYDENGIVLKDVGKGVECKGIKERISKVKELFYDFNKYGWFRAIRTGYAEGSGTVALEFPGNIMSCEINGTYKIDNDPRADIRQYYDGAVGSFFGYADAFRQYVTTDPAMFLWDNKVRDDPLPTMHDGSIVYIDTPDNLFYQRRRYYVSARLSGIRSRTLRLDWTYKDEANKPAVDVFFNLNCKIRE